jgi:hypothetical protein
MIVEQRIYTLHPGKAPAYLKNYQQNGYAVQKEHLGNLVGYYSTEIGPQNQIIHMWAYEDLADRERRRKALAADPRWQAYRDTALPYIMYQENKILIPAPFSPIVPS